MVDFLPLLTKDLFDNDLEFREYMKRRRLQISNYKRRISHPYIKKKKSIIYLYG